MIFSSEQKQMEFSKENRIQHPQLGVISAPTSFPPDIHEVSDNTPPQEAIDEFQSEEFKIQSYQVNYENTMAAKSRIMDADFAEETSRLARFQIYTLADDVLRHSPARAVPLASRVHATVPRPLRDHRSR